MITAAKKSQRDKTINLLRDALAFAESTPVDTEWLSVGGSSILIFVSEAYFRERFAGQSVERDADGEWLTARVGGVSIKARIACVDSAKPTTITLPALPAMEMEATNGT